MQRSDRGDVEKLMQADKTVAKVSGITAESRNILGW